VKTSAPVTAGLSVDVLTQTLTGAARDDSVRRSSVTVARGAATATAGGHWAGFVYDYCAAHQLLAVAAIDGALCGGIVVDFDEAEAAGLASEAVSHHDYRIHIYAVI
jgi:hypothetical protein